MSDTQDLTELQIPENMRIENEHEDERETETGYTGERPVSARDEMMKLISQRREEAINRELRQGEDYADQARETAGLERREREPNGRFRTVEEPNVEERGEPIVTREQQQAPLEEKSAVQSPALRVITIDGQQFSVTDEQYQQLAEQGIRTNVALSKHQQQAQPQQPRQQAQPQPQTQQPQRRGVLSKEDADAVADRLLYGGKDQVAATMQALAEHIANQTRQEAVDQEKITTEATRRAVQQTQEHNQLTYDLQVISGEFPDIFHDTNKGHFAALLLTHLRQEDQALGRSRTNLEAYREACLRVNDTLGKPRPGVSTSPATQAASLPQRASVTDRSQVLERKRVAPSQPIAVDRRASSSQMTRAKTGAEIVEQMRKARGQMAMT
jgi:hypothetical protein